MLGLECPIWFQTTYIAFDIIFFLISLAITITSIRAYMFLREERFKLFAAGFGFLTLSYLVGTLASCAILASNASLMTVTSYLFAPLFLVGLMLLLFVYLEINQQSVRALLLILVIAVVLAINRPMGSLQGIVFYLLGAVLLGFMVSRIAYKCHKNHKPTTLLVMIGFILLLVGQVLMAFLSLESVLFSLDSFFFVAASVATLLGLISISISRLLVKG